MTSQKLHLTKAAIEALPPVTRDTLIHDASQPGLALRCSPSGRKTFIVYRWHDGKPVKQKIGVWPSWSVAAARERARAIITELDTGGAPPPDTTLATLITDYTKHLRAQGARHPTYLEDLVRLHTPAGWLGRSAVSITRQDVVERHQTIATGAGPVAAARWVKALRSCYRHADLPCPATKVRINDSRPRSRFATKEEMARIETALATMSQQWQDYFHMLMYTGARRANVAAMRYENIHGATWLIPAKTFKTGEATEVHLLPQALEIIERRRGRSPWVFPADSKLGHIVEPYYAWQDVLERAQVKGLTIHDLRRTFAVRLVEAGLSLPIISKALGHRSPATTMRVYALATPDAYKSALDKVFG